VGEYLKAPLYIGLIEKTREHNTPGLVSGDPVSDPFFSGS